MTFLIRQNFRKIISYPTKLQKSFCYPTKLPNFAEKWKSMTKKPMSIHSQTATDASPES